MSNPDQTGGSQGDSMTPEEMLEAEQTEAEAQKALAKAAEANQLAALQVESTQLESEFVKTQAGTAARRNILLRLGELSNKIASLTNAPRIQELARLRTERSSFLSRVDAQIAQLQKELSEAGVGATGAPAPVEVERKAQTGEIQAKVAARAPRSEEERNAQKLSISVNPLGRGIAEVVKKLTGGMTGACTTVEALQKELELVQGIKLNPNGFYSGSVGFGGDGLIMRGIISFVGRDISKPRGQQGTPNLSSPVNAATRQVCWAATSESLAEYNKIIEGKGMKSI